MSSFSFIHAADIHLDSPQLNLERYDGAPVDEFRGATRGAFDKLVQLALDEEVRFVLVAGDLFDGDCKDWNTPLYLRKKLEELAHAGIDTFIVLGNHDAQSRMKKGLALRLPESVHFLSAEEAQTVELEDVQVVVHGRSFAKARETSDLSSSYPKPRAGMLNVGLLHTMCGAQEGHDPYAPSSVDGLTALGYEYWALGHIHKRCVLRDGEPWIVYPGNTQGRSVREQGAKGCTLVSVDGASITDVEHRDLDVCRWTIVNVDATECERAADILELVDAELEKALEAADGRSLAARVVVGGVTKLAGEFAAYATHWGEEIRSMAIDNYPDEVWVEKVKMEATAPKAPKVKAGKGASEDAAADSGLADELAALQVGPDDLKTALEDIKSLLDKIPREPRVEGADVEIGEPESLARLVEEAKQVLIARLQGSTVRVGPAGHDGEADDADEGEDGEK